MQMQKVKVMLFKPSGKWAHSYDAEIPEKYWDNEEDMLEAIDEVQTEVHKGTYKDYITVIVDYSGNNFVLGLHYPKTREALVAIHDNAIKKKQTSITRFMDRLRTGT